MTDKGTTHFGYEQVKTGDKAEKVRAVFDSVANRYDLMNDLMSFGIHRIWKRFTVQLAAVGGGQKILDLASGTGDIAAAFARLIGPQGVVIMSDINAAMLEQGRAKMVDLGMIGNIAYVQIDAERIPFPDNSFDCVTIGFGLRNVTDKQQALDGMYHVLKPGGRVLILEFSHPSNMPLRRAYDLYSFKLLPLMGKVVANDEQSYRYLAESIRLHPTQEQLKEMLELSGFERCDYHNLSGGIVAVHRGFKL